MLRLDRSDALLRTDIATSNFMVLRRPVESAQFTGMPFTRVLHDNKIAISMDGRGSWRDTVSDGRVSIGKYLNFYNGRRPHSSLNRQTPENAYFNALMPILVAA